MKNFLLMVAVILTVGSSAHGAEFYLRAGVTTQTMPGTGEVVPLWGFAQDSGPNVDDGVIQVPGPTLTVPEGDSSLVIHLENQLPNLNGQPTPVSIVIPGQYAAMVPIRSQNGRIRSFQQETLPGQVGRYEWNGFKSGTFLYQSGTHPAVQVQMGLYGAIKKSSAAGEAYPGKSYDREVLLVLGEFDSALHTAVATDNYGPGKDMTSTVNYRPQYFLINGKSYAAGDAPIAAGVVGEKVLIRVLNAGLDSRVLMLHKLHAKVISEDGNALPFPQEQYSIHLAAGKTMDVLMEATSAGLYPVHDRRMGLTSGANASGGMMTFLKVDPVPVLRHPAQAKKNAGIRVKSLRPTAGGYMLDLRYRILNKKKPGPFADRKVPVYLVHEKTGARLKVPAPPKVGPMRHVPRNPRTDRDYFVLFANPGKFLKSGDRVTIVAGDTKIKGVKIL